MISRIRSLSVFQRLLTTWHVFQDHNASHHAQSIAFSLILSLPALLLVGLSLLSLLGSASTVEGIAQLAQDAGADQDLVTTLVTMSNTVIQSNPAGVSFGFAIAILLALNTLSGAWNTALIAIRALHNIPEPDGNIVSNKLRSISETVVMAVFAVLALASLLLSGNIADVIGVDLGVIWNIGRLFLAVVFILLALRWLYTRAGLTVTFNRFGGPQLGLILLILSTILLFFYINSAGAYGAAFGALTSVIILMVWLRTCAMTVLFAAAWEVAEDLSEPTDGETSVVLRQDRTEEVQPVVNEAEYPAQRHPLFVRVLTRVIVIKSLLGRR